MRPPFPPERLNTVIVPRRPQESWRCSRLQEPAVTARKPILAPMAALSRAPVASSAALDVEAPYCFHAGAAPPKLDFPAELCALHDDSHAVIRAEACPVHGSTRSMSSGKEDVPAEPFSTMPRTPSATARARATAMAHDDRLELLTTLGLDVEASRG